MAHFAKLDSNNIVLEVHVVANAALDANDEEASGITFLQEWSGGHLFWKQTSYNRTFRKHYAGIGYTYDEVLDAFIPPKCHDEAVLVEATCLWDCDNEAHTSII